MKFETPMYSDGIVKSKQTVFGGLNHNPGAGDGQIYEMRNMCSDYYPLLATRAKRKKNRSIAGGWYENVFADDDLYYIDNTGGLFKGNTYKGQIGSSSEAAKTYIAKLNSYMIFYPQKKFYNTESGSVGNLESTWIRNAGASKFYNSVNNSTVLDSTHIKIPMTTFVSGATAPTVGTTIIKKARETIWSHGIPRTREYDQWTGTVTEIDGDDYTVELISGDFYPNETGPTYLIELWKSVTLHSVSFQDGTLYGESAVQNTIYCSAIDWSNYFNAGDAITISGSDIAENNKTIVVREVDEHELRFYEYSFTNGEETGEDFKLERTVPDMDGIFESGNRLWGWKGKTIYASKLGDPFNFNVFDGLDTDSWTAEIGGVGDLTGGIEYQGYPIFFREWGLFKVYGYMPSNFELIRTAETGLKEGCGKSLAIAGETLFYYNQNGFYAYAGGMPSKIGTPMGTRDYEDCIAGSDGQKYYCSARERGADETKAESWHLFVYDTTTGLWHEEDNIRATGFARFGESFVCAHKRPGLLSGQILTIGRTYYETEDLEDNFDWYVEFTDFTDDSPNKKDFKRLQIRLELDEDTADPPWVKAKLMMDSDGEWIEPEGGTIEDPEKRSYLMTIIPRRADHYRLRLEGHGGCRIYSIAREFSEGSDLKSMKGRQ